MCEVGNIAQNLKSGFRATSIFPFNGDVILEKLPRETNIELFNDTK